MNLQHIYSKNYRPNFIRIVRVLYKISQKNILVSFSSHNVVHSRRPITSDDRPMSSPSLVKFGPHTPENRPSEMPHTLKLDGGSVLKCVRKKETKMFFVTSSIKLGRF